MHSRIISMARSQEPILDALTKYLGENGEEDFSLSRKIGRKKGDVGVADYLHKGGAIGENHNEGGRRAGRRNRSKKRCTC